MRQYRFTLGRCVQSNFSAGEITCRPKYTRHPSRRDLLFVENLRLEALLATGGEKRRNLRSFWHGGEERRGEERVCLNGRFYCYAISSESFYSRGLCNSIKERKLRHWFIGCKSRAVRRKQTGLLPSAQPIGARGEGGLHLLPRLKSFFRIRGAVFLRMKRLIISPVELEAANGEALLSSAAEFAIPPTGGGGRRRG